MIAFRSRNIIKCISIIPLPISPLSIFRDPRTIPLSASISCRCIDVAAAKGRETIATEGNRADGEGKKHTQRNLTRCGEAILSRQTFQEISSGNLRHGTPARAEISSEIRGNWELLSRARVCMCVCMCVLYVRIRDCVCAERQGYGGYFGVGVSEGSEGDLGDRLIARPIVGADQRAKASRVKMRAIFDIRGTFIAALLSRAREPRCVIDKRVHLLSRLIKFGMGMP